MNEKIIASGMRPTGRIHIGNYIGVIKNWITLQKKYNCFFFIADLHALTTDFNNILNITYNTKMIIKEWLACGINPDYSNIFIQSHIPETFELNTILSMMTPITWLERVPSYKAIKNNTNNSYGFLGYPVLQGADIIILDAEYVPIGEDQLPHLEIIREIIRKINTTIKSINNTNIDLIKEPIPLLFKYKNIPGTDGTKMSKSKNNTILISDEHNILDKKIKKLITDSKRIKISIPGIPEDCSVWTFHKIYSDIKTKDYVYKNCKSAGIGCVECKNILYNNINKKNNILIKKIKIYDKKEKYINDIIEHGRKNAQTQAEKILKNIKKNLNLI